MTRHHHYNDTTTTVPSSHHHHHNHHTTTAAAPRRRRPMFSFRMGRRQPVHHQRRHASIGDKISGAMMKLRGSLTRRPGLKAAGTRRMRGTDGRGSVRSGYY